MIKIDICGILNSGYAPKMFIARNIIFYPGYSEDNIHELSDEIMIPSFHLNKIMNRFEDNDPLLITMTNIDKDLKCLVAI